MTLCDNYFYSRLFKFWSCQRVPLSSQRISWVCSADSTWGMVNGNIHCCYFLPSFFFCPIEKQWLKIYIPNIYLIPKYNLGVRFTPRKRYIYTNSNKETIRSTLCFFFFFNMTSLFVYECLSDGQCSLSHRKSKLSEEPYYCIAS